METCLAQIAREREWDEREKSSTTSSTPAGWEWCCSVILSGTGLDIKRHFMKSQKAIKFNRVTFTTTRGAVRWHQRMRILKMICKEGEVGERDEKHEIPSVGWLEPLDEQAKNKLQKYYNWICWTSFVWHSKRHSQEGCRAEMRISWPSIKREKEVKLPVVLSFAKDPIRLSSFRAAKQNRFLNSSSFQ